MSSTVSFSIKKILSDYKHYIFTFNSDEEKKCLLFPNAEGFEKRKKCLGLEMSFEFLSSFFEDNSYNRRSDLTIYSKFDVLKTGKYKFSFSVDCDFLSGNYILLNPAWGAKSRNKMWCLIPSKKLK